MDKVVMKKRWWLSLLGLLLLSFFIRAYRLGSESLWFDEASTARNVALPPAQIVEEVSVAHVPYTLLLKAFPALESTEFGLRYPSALFGTFGVAALFAAGRRIGGRRLGALGALLLALSPMHLWYSREARSYSLTLAVTLLAVIAYLDLLRRPGTRRLLGLIAAQTILFYAHFLASLNNLWLSLYVTIIQLRKRDWKALGRWLGAEVIVLLIASPFVGLMLWGNARKNLLGWVERPGLSSLAELSMYFSGTKYLKGYSWAWLVWLLWLFLLLGAAVQVGRYRLKIHNHDANFDVRLFFLSWAFIPLIALLSVSWLVKPIYVHRYVLYTLPAYLLLIGALAVHSNPRGPFLLLCLVCLGAQSLGSYGVLASTEYSRPDWRTAQREIAPAVDSQDVLLFHPWHLQRPYEYYNRSHGSIPVSQLISFSDPLNLVGDPAAALITNLTDLEAGIRRRGQRLWIFERVFDTRASEWFAQRSGWRLASEDRFVGSLEVRLYVYDQDAY